MIALSFLGVGNYEETEYKYQQQIIKTKYFPYAVSQFVKLDKLFVIMTKKAEKTHAASLKNICDFESIKIPDGKSEEEFWIIFDKITEVINEGDEIVFDITHGFRSQPFIVIVLLLYLKALKNIKIKNILYGAFEAKDKNNITPVFELKPFIDLIDWSNAVHEFIENGNMKYFNSLLSNIHKNSHINKLREPSKELKGAGENLSKLTDAFSTMRLDEIFINSFNFSKRIERLQTDLINNPQAKPFGNLINKISEQFSLITEAENDVFSEKGIEAQKSILQWYIDTGKYQKAITLAREYIVTKHLIEINNILDDKKLLDKNNRASAEQELGSLLNSIKKRRKLSAREKDFAEVWSKITDSRNDINHAGMRKNPTSSKCLIKQIKIIIEQIINYF